MSGTRKRDRRVERTRHLLRHALLSLMTEKEFDSITVQEVIDRADVGRATFYAHFDSKEDLLVSGLDQLRDELRERQRDAAARSATSADARLFAFSRELFAHCAQHPDMFRHMAGKRMAPRIESLTRDVLTDLIRADLKPVVPRREGMPFEALVQFLSGALFGVLIWWIDRGRRMPPEEADALFRQLALPSVKALR